jgi:hypothetical protein
MTRSGRREAAELLAEAPLAGCKELLSFEALEFNPAPAEVYLYGCVRRGRGYPLAAVGAEGAGRLPALMPSNPTKSAADFGVRRVRRRRACHGADQLR